MAMRFHRSRPQDSREKGVERPVWAPLMFWKSRHSASCNRETAYCCAAREGLSAATSISNTKISRRHGAP